MRTYYHRDSPRIRWWTRSQVLALVSGLSLFASAGLIVIIVALHRLAAANPAASGLLPPVIAGGAIAASVALVASLVSGLIGAVSAMMTSPESRICHVVHRAIGDPRRGNPLHLGEGVMLPDMRCDRWGTGYILTIWAQSAPVEAIEAAASSISSALCGRYSRYAVTRTETDPSFNYVRFYIQDVMANHQLVPASVEEMVAESPYLLTVQDDTEIDLRTSGHMLVAGRTRSGKTTAVMGLLLQVLHHQRALGDGEVAIIDPKGAELSTLPGAVKPDEDGGGRAILKAMRSFERLRRERQARLNELQLESGDAVHWWDAGMAVSVLFIDEFIHCRSLFPARATKDDPDYCQRAFDDLVKSLVTQGASAGCYVVISVAQPSVVEGGIPSLVREACTTRILFRPSLADARLMWSAAEAECVAQRWFRPGEAWFTSTDGEHDAISFVRFPNMERMRPYAELRRALSQ